MDLSSIQVVLGLAASAVGLTKEAAATVAQVKKAVSGGDGGNSIEAQDLLNMLATNLMAANMANVQLSSQLKVLSDAIFADEAFQERKSRYRLTDTGHGDMILVLRPEAAHGDPPHFVCPICLEKDRRFHFVTGPNSGNGKHCQGCRHYFEFREPDYSY